MEFTLYRNHTPACKKLLAETTYRRYTGTEQKKAIVRYTGCQCIWWYRRKGQPHGKSTETADETEAKAKVNALRADAKDPDVHGRKLAECTEMFTESKAVLAPGSLKHYRLLFAALLAYASLCDITHIRQITVEFIVNFRNRALPGIADTTKKTM